MFVFFVVFCNAIFQYRFSFGNLRAMAMDCGTHCGYCRSGYWLYFYYHGLISAFLLAVLLQIGVAIICGFSICAALSVGLLIYLK
jgi:DHA1 family bicyclomycin/chloramphenicol resistance-like MFS transporter